MARVRRAAVAVLLAGVFSLLDQPVADAHIAGAAGSPSNEQATVTAVRPATPGIQVSVGLGGQWVRIGERPGHQGAGTTDVTVLGYHGEPFLRLVDGQVQVNEASDTAVQAGQTRGSGVSRDPATPPRWVTQRSATEMTWSDARLHMPAPAAEAATSWTLPITVDGRQISVTGTTQRLPAPSPWPWAAALVVIAAAVAALGWSRRWHRPVAAAVTVGAVAFGLHLIGTGLAPQQSGPVFGWVGVGAVGAFALAIGAVTVSSIARRSRMAGDRVITTGIMVLLLAATDISALWNAELPFAGPAALDRGLVVLTYACALGLLVAGTRLTRQARRSAVAEPAGR